MHSPHVKHSQDGQFFFFFLVLKSLMLHQNSKVKTRVDILKHDLAGRAPF